MERGEGLFLEALKAALESRQVNWDREIGIGHLEQVLKLAQCHHVLPMIYEAIHSCPAATLIPEGIQQCRKATFQLVMEQTVKTQEFLELYSHLNQKGIAPLVVKGIICRNLYPQPDGRHSGDEDVFCGERQFTACHKELVRFGMEPCSSTLDSYEVPYRKEDGLLYIELHKTLFAQDSDIFSDCNRSFEGSFEHPAQVMIQGVPVWTLCPSEHLLYLILHAYKHFLHSGFGIRQVCDMVLFANAYGQQIDWHYVQKKCKGLRAERFAAAIFAMGEKYLTFSPEQAHYPRSWRELKADPDPLLEDLLRGGIYGTADPNRVHSCGMTLNAVKADKAGRQGGNILHTIFPPVQLLQTRFPWLHRHPRLLPVAWFLRLAVYVKNVITRTDSSAATVIRVGNQRVDLLRQYDIID